MVGGAQQGAFGVKKAGEGELAAKIDAPISICMLVTSVIQRNPGPIRAQGGPMQRDSEGGLGSRAFGGVGGGVCNIVLIQEKRLTIKEQDTR